MNDLTPESINVATWKIPSPLGIIGSHANGEFNGMTASWITQVSMDPPLIGVGIDNKSVTFNLMNESDFFTINMFSPEYTKVFVKFSKPAEYSKGYLNKEPITLNGLNKLKDEIGELLGKRGKEFGTVTSRKRRCGWFDGILVRQTIKISGINGIALTKLDVLDEVSEIKMCVGYELINS